MIPNNRGYIIQQTHQAPNSATALVAAQNSQAIQSQGQSQQQNAEVNQGQVQQTIVRDTQSNAAASQVHMTPQMSQVN